MNKIIILILLLFLILFSEGVYAYISHDSILELNIEKNNNGNINSYINFKTNESVFLNDISFEIIGKIDESSLLIKFNNINVYDYDIDNNSLKINFNNQVLLKEKDYNISIQYSAEDILRYIDEFKIYHLEIFPFINNENPQNFRIKINRGLIPYPNGMTSFVPYVIYNKGDFEDKYRGLNKNLPEISINNSEYSLFIIELKKEAKDEVSPIDMYFPIKEDPEIDLEFQDTVDFTSSFPVESELIFNNRKEESIEYRIEKGDNYETNGIVIVEPHEGHYEISPKTSLEVPLGRVGGWEYGIFDIYPFDSGLLKGDRDIRVIKKEDIFIYYSAKIIIPKGYSINYVNIESDHQMVSDNVFDSNIPEEHKILLKILKKRYYLKYPLQTLYEEITWDLNQFSKKDINQEEFYSDKNFLSLVAPINFATIYYEIKIGRSFIEIVFAVILSFAILLIYIFLHLFKKSQIVNALFKKLGLEKKKYYSDNLIIKLFSLLIIFLLIVGFFSSFFGTSLLLIFGKSTIWLNLVWIFIIIIYEIKSKGKTPFGVG